MSKDKLGEAIGIWHITVGGADLEVTPVVEDTRRFRDDVLMNSSKSDRGKMFRAFEKFLTDLIHREHSHHKREDIEAYVCSNVNELIEETMVKFRWTTKEDLAKSRKEATQDLKKMIGDG